jgi:hypothetical protein
VSGNEEYEVEETVHDKAKFFKDPIPKAEIENCPVDEKYLSAYEELKADMKSMEDTLETMNAAIKAARMGTEKTLQLGKMVVKFTDVEGSPKVDWKNLVEQEIGKVDPLTMKRYSKEGKASVRIEVLRLG